MKFEKGISGNPQGRPKGSKNKDTEIKEKVKTLVLDNREQFKDDIKKMNPKDRATVMMKALDFVVPKLKTMEVNTKIQTWQEQQNLTLEQIDRLIEKL